MLGLRKIAPLGSLITESFQEGDQCAAFLRGELQALDRMFGEVGIEGVTAVHAVAVVVDDFLQCGEATIMHVGRGAGDVS